VVVCSTVVEEGTLFSVWVVVVVVVVGAGCSSTVVHEVRNKAATASSGIRVFSFFIVKVFPFKGQIDAGSSARCISNKVFQGPIIHDRVVTVTMGRL